MGAPASPAGAGVVTSAGASSAVASGSGVSGAGVELPQARASEDTTIKATTFKLVISTILLFRATRLTINHAALTTKDYLQVS